MLRVLIVDDSKFMARGMKTVVEGLGFEVVDLGHDGQEGFDKYLQYKPDVTLLDITMPNVCGIECLTRIMEADGDASVVMLSAVQDQDTVSRCLEIGARSFLAKPIRKNEPEDLQKLKETIENASKSLA